VIGSCFTPSSDSPQVLGSGTKDRGSKGDESEEDEEESTAVADLMGLPGRDMAGRDERGGRGWGVGGWGRMTRKVRRQ